MSGFVIDSMSKNDWEQVRAIYMEGIATANATFETESPSWSEWNAKHHAFARLVAREADYIHGWVALGPVSSRAVYAGVADESIYIRASSRGQGIGLELLRAAIEESEQNRIWTLQAGIFPENRASIALHTKCGFREVGRRERIGCMQGVWRDVILFERRSLKVGL